ncbi:Rad17p [Sugiyamaella lignohabitans]|uniref:Rad17p n=1 Tax=Sugiyamaella lignohabitans TaxID=796027 RepID=A0A167EFU7_9ASCO|nr:Rad17p [Sugiyamaella lignohabitans]ANB14028.1 Rad17p [Sugiyamaella lignohabitans]
MDVLFTATTTHVHHIYRVLKAISVTGKEASITVSDQGLKISVENASKSCQAHLFLNETLFSVYKFRPDLYNELETNDNINAGDATPLVATFNISLRALTGCLQIFADSTDKTTNSTNTANSAGGRDFSQRERQRANGNVGGNGKLNEISVSNQCLFVYRGPGYPFMIYFTQGLNAAVTTKCELATYDRNGSFDNPEKTEMENDYDDESQDAITIDPNSIVQKVILKGNVMEDALKELDAINTSIITIRASAKTAPHFTFISEGELGKSEYSFPNEGKILEVFLVAPPGQLYNGDIDSVMDRDDYDTTPDWVVVNSYAFATFNLIRETVFLANRINIRCDALGVMSIQSLCEGEPGCQSYIDFRFLPSEE